MGLGNLRAKYSVLIEVGDTLYAVGSFYRADQAQRYGTEQQETGYGVFRGIAQVMTRPMFRIHQAENKPRQGSDTAVRWPNPRLTGPARDTLRRTVATQYANGATVRQLAAQTGRSQGLIVRLVVEAGIPLRGSRGDRRKQSTGDPKTRPAYTGTTEQHAEE